ncbi:hypothetical protein A1Q_0876 [Vibrio campbellii HY01]|nr:hypothetical protein A1Q_0876 [Vibrio campbellii HY01]
MPQESSHLAFKGFLNEKGELIRLALILLNRVTFLGGLFIS